MEEPVVLRSFFRIIILIGMYVSTIAALVWRSKRRFLTYLLGLVINVPLFFTEIKIDIAFVLSIYEALIFSVVYSIVVGIYFSVAKYLKKADEKE